MQLRGSIHSGFLDHAQLRKADNGARKKPVHDIMNSPTQNRT